MEKLYYYDIELRDINGNLYENSNGTKLVSRTFQFTDKTDKNFICLVCQNAANNYKAVCKEGTEINIEVRFLDEVSNTYPIAYSFNSKENKFIKH